MDSSCWTIFNIIFWSHSAAEHTLDVRSTNQLLLRKFLQVCCTCSWFVSSSSQSSSIQFQSGDCAAFFGHVNSGFFSSNVLTHHLPALTTTDQSVCLPLLRVFFSHHSDCNIQYDFLQYSVVLINPNKASEGVLTRFAPTSIVLH